MQKGRTVDHALISILIAPVRALVVTLQMSVRCLQIPPVLALNSRRNKLALDVQAQGHPLALQLVSNHRLLHQVRQQKVLLVYQLLTPHLRHQTRQQKVLLMYQLLAPHQCHQIRQQKVFLRMINLRMSVVSPLFSMLLIKPGRAARITKFPAGCVNPPRKSPSELSASPNRITLGWQVCTLMKIMPPTFPSLIPSVRTPQQQSVALLNAKTDNALWWVNGTMNTLREF
mmetsp:Transcript_29389/g.62421  ORF Transcript_29389/g.62421 Transcript_29389/m.62421 type:complete len:229 (+) Transcript_29389:274-960(+)